MPISWQSVTALTRSKYIPLLADNLYKSNPLFVLLDRQERIVLDGGVDVREPLLMATEPFTWYSGFDVLDITPPDPIRFLVLNWRLANTAITIDGEAELANAGEPKVISLVESRVHNGELTIKDNIGTGLFNDGTIAKAIDGLRTAVNSGNTYAGINRATNTWFNANLVAAGSVDPTFTFLQKNGYGAATQGETAPDLLLCTQPLWNKLWAQALPQQRFDGGDEVLVGWPFMRFNKARLVVDSHVPTGFVFMLNTEFIKLFVHRDRDFITTDWLPALNQDARTMHIRWAGNLVVNNPRFHSAISGLSET